jgi:hypothetical protein
MTPVPRAVGGKWSVARWIAGAWIKRTSLYNRIDPESDADVTKQDVEFKIANSYLGWGSNESNAIEESFVIGQIQSRYWYEKEI